MMSCNDECCREKVKQVKEIKNNARVGWDITQDTLGRSLMRRTKQRSSRAEGSMSQAERTPMLRLFILRWE